MRTEFLPESFALKEREREREREETTALPFGRRSYEAFAPIWRDSEDHDAYRGFPMFVVSSTLAESDLVALVYDVDVPDGKSGRDAD